MAKSAEVTFAPVQAPPPQVREPVLSEEAANALAQALSENEFVSDQIEYGTEDGASRKAHNAVSKYRAALAHYSLIPEGKTLRSRVVNGFLYLRWGEPRGADVSTD